MRTPAGANAAGVFLCAGGVQMVGGGCFSVIVERLRQGALAGDLEVMPAPARS
jgi:hypothetical protein